MDSHGENGGIGSVFPLHGKVPGASAPVENSVEARWPPLTPEHGFPSLQFGPDTGRSPSVRSRWPGAPVCFPHASLPAKELKNGGDLMVPAALENVMTSYGGITRIR